MEILKQSLQLCDKSLCYITNLETSAKQFYHCRQNVGLVFSLFLMHTHTCSVHVCGYCVYVYECCICMCECVSVCVYN